MIDLHIHSTASDGTCSPSEIIEIAHNLNLKAIAITDHDTIEGSKDASKNFIPQSLKFLTGVEISANPPESFPCSGSLHILGYGINLDDLILNQALNILQESRKNRNPLIINRLNSLGIDLTLQEVIDGVGEGQIGRPHIARVMIMKGLVKSINEAFDKFLGKGQPAYVDKYRIECSRAIEIIINAGGIPVLAHPFLIKPKNEAPIEDLIITLKEMRLKGIEVYYPEHSPWHMEYYAKIAKNNNLLVTGGTDFHGSLKPDIEMGSGRGNLSIPYNIYEQLINKHGNK